MNISVSTVVGKQGETTTAAETKTVVHDDGPTLRPEHVEYLRVRAITMEIAVTCGLRSVSGDDGARLIGRVRALGSDGIDIPYQGTEPIYHRIRLDSGKPRYIAPTGREVPIYVPQLITPEMLANTALVLIVVEGPIKAISLTANGIPALGLGGVATTLMRDSIPPLLNDSWGRISLTGRRVIILFDADKRTNPLVAAAEVKLALALESAGADVSCGSLM